MPVFCDVVLVSDAKNNVLRNLTANAIKSAGNSVNIIVVESNEKVVYENAQVIHAKVPFNYNHYLNIGAHAGNSPFIFFGNNDLIFNADWDTELIETMNKNNADSASPICPYTHSIFDIGINSGIYEGYDNIRRFCGWAFMWRRSLFEEAGGLDESFSFWCSDNCTIEQLINLNKKHILVTSSIVNHLSKGHNTIRFSDGETQQKYTFSETEKFIKKYGKDWRINWPPLYEL